ncbi:MAG: flavodoxin family protein [Bacilli bacterium]
MARVLIIVGSRREGNSAILAKKLQNSLQESRISCDVITPGNQKIYLCTGCMDCDLNGVCDFSDAMASNITKINTAEYLIFITPTRWNTLSGDLKIFMDRLNPLYSTRGLKNKKMISLVIGSKPKSVYSTDGCLTSLGSFAESAMMDVVYTHEFNDCLMFEDILKQEENMMKVIMEIKELINNN